MINFFRKKRKKLADDNQALKPALTAGWYIHHAIGEIGYCSVRNKIPVALFINSKKRAFRYKI